MNLLFLKTFFSPLNRLSAWANGRFPLIPPLLISLFALPALQPLLQRQLTCGFDNAFHLWRAVEAGALIREGIWFSRWAPHMAHGYGYPLFLFQSPLSAYLAAFLNIGGLDWPLAINAIYGVGLVGSGVAAWWLAREFWGERGGVLTAVALTSAPYHLYVLYYRASLSETVAWIFPPLVLWGIWRWQMMQQRRGLVTAVFGLTLLFYTHDVTGYIFMPLFLAWPIGLSWIADVDSPAPTHQSPAPTYPFTRGITAVLLGFFLASFFWLPALIERQHIQFGRAGTAWPFLPENNFLPIDQLLALPHNADPLLLNDWPARGLGVVLFVLALLGIVYGWRQAGMVRRLTAVLTVLLTSYLFLVTPASRFLWDNISILAAFQFPWRFLSPVVLLTSLLVGAVVNQQDGVVVKNKKLKVNSQQFPLYSFTLLLYVLIPLLHFGWLAPAHCDAPSDTTIEGMVAWERATGTLGTTASRELLPTTVERLPEDDSASLPWVNRLSSTTMPEGATMNLREQLSMSTTFNIDTPESFMAVYQAFAFPGWQVEIDGVKVDITPQNQDGLITFNVPNGRSTIRVFRANTAVQNWGLTFSLTTLIITMTLLLKQPPLSINRLHSPFTTHHSPFIILFILTLFIFALNQTSLFKQTRWQNGQLTAVDTPSTLTFGTPENSAQVALLGYDELPQTVPADEAITLSFYWQALVPLTTDYHVGLTLVDENGVRWSENGLRDYRWTRSAPLTTAWPTDRYTQTSFFADLLPGTPPGLYSLELTFFDINTLQPLTAYQDGVPLGPIVTLGNIEAMAPKRPFTPQNLNLPAAPPISNDDIAIYRALFDRTSATPGDNLLITLFWQIDNGEAKTIEMQLIDPEGQQTAVFPITLTPRGDGIWRQQTLVRLPASLSDGSHQWRLLFGNGATFDLDMLEIEAPSRLFERPSTDLTLEAIFDERIALIGVTNKAETIEAGEALELSLVWQGLTELPDSYRVFVQLLAENGRILSQSDGVPAQWTRPTTGWQPGEYIVDTHILTVPETVVSGEYRLIVGLYTEGNGRLQIENGLDFFELENFSLR